MIIKDTNMKKLFSTLMLLALTAAAFAQNVTWSFSVKETSDSTADILLTAKVAAGYHIYSQYTTGTSAPVEFKFAESKDYKLVGKVKEPKAHEEPDEFVKGGIEKSFSGTVVFRQQIKRLSTSDFKVSGVVNYQYCDENSCQFDDASFALNVKGAQVAVAAEPAAEVADTTPAVAEPEAVVAEAESIADTENEESAGDSLLWIFLGALAGGIVTMFTPCVFPMIPMTVNFFMNGSSNKRKNRRQALFFGFSIVFLFAVLGAVLALIFGPDALYFIGVHWIPNLIFFVIFIIFSMSFFGLFEIKMPEKWINKSDEQADKGGFFAPFFIALTTVLVSFSCTGPILGAALVGLTTSGTGNQLVSLITMLGFGIGFALPFTLLAFFPGVLKNMKSGGWLNTVKVVFAFLELAFGLKFLQQADLYCGWGLLDREWYLALWIVIFAMLGFYLLGKLKFKGDSPIEKLGVGRTFLSIGVFAFVVYMIPGLWGAPLKGISGFLPPMESQDFNLAKHTATVESASTAKLPADRLFASELHAPDGYEAFYDLEEAKAYAKEHNMPIFIDFTGKTCANCREMEHYVWSDAKVMEILSQKFVMCALYADADIDLPEQCQVTDESGNTITSLGKKNREFQKKLVGMCAQPYYVIIDTDEHILTKENHQYDRDVQKFIDFLNEGLANYSK